MTSRCKFSVTVVTKYHGPTNFRGARLSASWADGEHSGKRRMFFPYPDELEAGDAHESAARLLLATTGQRDVNLLRSLGPVSGYLWTVVS